MLYLLSKIRVVNLRKEFKEVVAINDLTFNFPDSKITCLLGPSGCGKTTLLRMIAGLETMSSGDIYFNDLKVNDIPPRKRNIGMVFQYPVVYQGISVYRNIELPLLIGKLTKKERKKRISEVAELLGIQDSLKKYVDKIDNATRQKVAVAREVARMPEILLFDEPITNVDANAKYQFKYAFRKLMKSFKKAVIYVTHDQTEAMTFGDEIALMKDGKIIQCDLPRTLYNNPESVFGGWFLGNPGMNFIKRKYEKQNGKGVIKLFQPYMTLNVNDDANIKGEVTIGIRPEHIKVVKAPSSNTLRGEVVRKSITIGGLYLLVVKIKDIILKIKTKDKIDNSLQDKIWVKLPIEKLFLFDKQGKRLHVQISLQA